MIQTILDFFMQIKGDAVMALFPLALLPTAVSLLQSGIGAIGEGQKRKEMAAERTKWNADNEAMFNKDYYSDYTQRADTQNLIKRMRDEQKNQNTIDQNTAVVTGATPEAQNAAKERRNKAMTSVFSNIAAQGSAFKDRAKNQYLNRKTAIEGMNYDDMSQSADSSGNLLYNGLKGIGNTDWASIMGGKKPVVGSKQSVVGGTNVGFDQTPVPENMITNPEKLSTT